MSTTETPSDQVMVAIFRAIDAWSLGQRAASEDFKMRLDLGMHRAGRSDEVEPPNPEFDPAAVACRAFLASFRSSGFELTAVSE